MYQQGDRVLYGIHGVCQIISTEIRKVDRKSVEYFALEPLEQPGTRYYIPTQNQTALLKLRPILSGEALKTLLTSSEIQQDVWINDESQRKLCYRDLLANADRCALLQMITTLYRQKQLRIKAGKKFHLCDENFLRDALKIIASEYAFIFGVTPKEAGEHIRNTILEPVARSCSEDSCLR